MNSQSSPGRPLSFPQTIRTVAAPLLLLALSISGCRGEPERTFRDPSDVQDYSELPKLRETHFVPLRDEYARLIAEQATPQQVHSFQFPMMSEPPAYVDGISAVVDIIPPQTAEKILRFQVGYRDGRWNPAFSNDKVRSFLTAYATEREAYEKLMRRDAVQYPVEMTTGLTAELTFLDSVQAGQRLLAAAAMDDVEHGRLSAAAQLVDALFRGAEALARVNHVLPRIEAVHQRERILQLVAAIVDHRQCTANDRTTLLQLISRGLNTWPHDAKAWIGDRAAGLHTYELVRDGYLLSLLQPDEFQNVTEKLGRAKLQDLLAENLDQDQLFYLESMRELIAACDRPYASRQAILRRIENELESLRETNHYPLVADLLLLVDVEKGHRLQAVDLARMRGWQLALATALDLDPQIPISPVTGFRFILERSESRILVDGIDPEGNEPPIEIRGGERLSKR